MIRATSFNNEVRNRAGLGGGGKNGRNQPFRQSLREVKKIMDDLVQRGHVDTSSTLLASGRSDSYIHGL